MDVHGGNFWQRKESIAEQLSVGDDDEIIEQSEMFYIRIRNILGLEKRQSQFFCQNLHGRGFWFQSSTGRFIRLREDGTDIE